MLEDVVRSTSGTEQLLRHCAPSLPLPQLPAGASRALSGEKGGEEGHCVLFNGDRASGEQLSSCCHSDAPFRWPLEATVHPPHVHRSTPAAVQGWNTLAQHRPKHLSWQWKSAANSVLPGLASALYPKGFGKLYWALCSYDDLLKILLTFSHMLSSAWGIFLKQICVTAEQSAYPLLIMLRWEASLIPHLFKEDKPWRTEADKYCFYQPAQERRKLWNQVSLESHYSSWQSSSPLRKYCSCFPTLGQHCNG